MATGHGDGVWIERNLFHSLLDHGYKEQFYK